MLIAVGRFTFNLMAISGIEWGKYSGTHKEIRSTVVFLQGSEIELNYDESEQLRKIIADVVKQIEEAEKA
jgi:hypothetical protein